MLKFPKSEPTAKQPRPTPRISVNKLAEYIEASVTRRRTILEQCKTPPSITTNRYAMAREAMKSYMASNDVAFIDSCLETLSTADKSTTYKKSDVESSIEVLNLIKQMGLPELQGFSLSAWGAGNPLLNIKGVDVSVNPDLLITGTKRKNEVIGVLKLSIIKTNPLSFYGQSVVALLAKEFLATSMPNDSAKIDPKICVSLDAFQQRLVPCQSAGKERMRSVEAACQEIASRWDSI